MKQIENEMNVNVPLEVIKASEIEPKEVKRSFGKKKTVMSVAVGLLSATLQVFGMPQATILGWIPATHVGSRSALRPTALAVSEGTIRTASGLI